jgi:hypothetical protein
MIAGATHPHVRALEGDRYRLELQALAKKLGVEQQVLFVNRFVAPEEMAALVGSADIYITPYCHEAQAVSGTLAYALGAGKAIISTPYWHAAEVLDHGRGLLVPFETRRPSQKRQSSCWTMTRHARQCVSVPTFMLGLWSGSGLRSPIWPHSACSRPSLRNRFN